MKPTVSVQQLSSNAAALRRAVAALTDRDVYIGIPANKNAARQGVTNADLGYIHEFGAPAANIPARPHLIPGITDIQPQAAELLETAGKKALEGDEAAVDRALNKIGLLGQKAVHARFVNNDWPTLARSSRGSMRAGQSPDAPALLAPSAARGATPSVKEAITEEREKTRNPLIDSGQLRKSYTYVIRKRRGGMIVPEGQ